jgi:hypothetical protein
MADQIERHTCCPQCGSKRFKFAASSTKLVDKGLAAALPIRDRICKDCGTLYHPEMPAIVPYTLMGVGVGVALLGVMAFFAPLMSGPVGFQWWVKFLLLAGGAGLFLAGLQLLRKKP